MIFLIVVTNSYVLVTNIGAQVQNHDFCFPLANIELCSRMSKVTAGYGEGGTKMKLHHGQH